MRKGLLFFVVVLMAVSLFAAGAFAAETNPLEELKTPAELSNWERTTSSQEVIDYCIQVAQHSSGRVRMEYIGRSVRGRLIPMLIIGTPAPKDPSEVSSAKAIVYVNCNIHSGEIEGKESMLIFAREAALGQHDDILKDLVLLIVPNMSPDGNDDLGTWRNRTQQTPLLAGTRPNGQGFNINRDMTRLESYEAQGVVQVLNKWDPVIFIDAHATNGSFMQHAVTWNWGLHPNTDEDLMAYNRDDFFQLALGPKSYLASKGKVSIPYGNFTNTVADGRVWQTFEDYPRYTTNYAGLRNRLAILLEVYSYDEYKRRVDTQYECIYGIFLAVQQEKETIKELIAKADARTIGRSTNGLDPLVDNVALNSYLVSLDEVDGGYVDVMTYESGTRIQDPDTGYYTGMTYGAKQTERIPYYGKFVPTGTRPMGAYYIFDPANDAALNNLLTHGIEVFKTEAPMTLADFEWFKAEKMSTSTTLYEGHYMNAPTGTWEASEDLTLPAGMYVVSTAQTRGSLAALLLEPECVDGLVAWNFFDGMSTVSGYYDRFSSTTTDTPRAKTIRIPIWKVMDFDGLSNVSLVQVAGLPIDETLPAPVEPNENIFASKGGDSSNCNTGVSATLAALIGIIAVSLKMTRKKK